MKNSKWHQFKIWLMRIFRPTAFYQLSNQREQDFLNSFYPPAFFTMTIEKLVTEGLIDKKEAECIERFRTACACASQERPLIYKMDLDDRLLVYIENEPFNLRLPHKRSRLVGVAMGAIVGRTILLRYPNHPDYPKDFHQSSDKVDFIRKDMAPEYMIVAADFNSR